MIHETAFPDDAKNLFQNNNDIILPSSDEIENEDTCNDDSNLLMAHITDQQPDLDPSDLYHALCTMCSRLNNQCNNHETPKKATPEDHDDWWKHYQQINLLKYNISKYSPSATAALIERKATNFVAGDNVCMLHKTIWKIDITSINSHSANEFNVVNSAGVVGMQNRLCFAILHQNVHLGKKNNLL